MCLRNTENYIKHLSVLNYLKGRCTKKCIAINEFGSVLIKIAKYLELSKPKLYTEHCFWRLSVAIYADAGSDILDFKRYGRKRLSTLAKRYVASSLKNKIAVSSKLTGCIINNVITSN